MARKKTYDGRVDLYDAGQWYRSGGVVVQVQNAQHPAFSALPGASGKPQHVFCKLV